MRYLMRPLLLWVCVFAVLGTAACRRSENQTRATATKGAAQESRFLNFHNWNEPEYLDPALISGRYESNIARNIFEGLVQHDPKDATAEPAGAERWTISDEGKTYTFSLRRQARWTDGHPVTAHDYVYAWERVLNPTTGSKYAFALYYFKNGQAYNTGKLTDPKQLGFRAVDDYTVEVKLEQPVHFLLGFLCHPAFFPAPRWAIERHGPRWTQPENIISNGPFQLVTWIPNKELVVVKSPTYWDTTTVKLPGVRYLPVEDKDTALKMYEAGELDLVWEIPVAKIPAYANHPDHLYSVWNTTDYYEFNVTKPPFNDRRVRQAFSLAIDREVLVTKYLQGTKMLAESFVPDGIAGYTPVKGHHFDPARAKALLAEAGYQDPRTFPSVELHYNTDDENKLVAQVIQQMWKQHLGITVTLRNEEWKTYMKTQKVGDFQISRRGWVGDYLDPNTFLEMYTSTSTINFSGWKNPDYDAVMHAALKERREPQRMALLHQAEEILLREAAITPTFFETLHMLVKPYVKGVYANIMDVHPLKHASLDLLAVQGR